METLKKIWEFLKAWAKTTLSLLDRNSLLHITCSLALVLIFALMLPTWAAAVLAFMIGVAKEVIYDGYLGKGVPDHNDVIFDLLGIIIALSLMAFLGL